MRKIPFAGIELTSQRVRGYMVPLSYRGDLELINGKVILKAIYRYVPRWTYQPGSHRRKVLYEGNIRAEMSILSSLILQSL